tara:strand:+ start:48 stop:335 length:288 start_codon:yes stop_codon:yes gene_type:complete
MDKQTKIIIVVSSLVVIGGVVALYLYSKPKSKSKNEETDSWVDFKKSLKPKDSFINKNGHIIKLSNRQMIEVKERGLTEEDLQRMEDTQSGIFTK